MTAFIAAIGNLWCRQMHSRSLWPIHGKVICATCLREHACGWELPRADPSRPAAEAAAGTNPVVAISEAS